MSYNLCRSSEFLGNRLVSSPATSQPEFFAQGSNLHQKNNTLRNNIAEGVAINSNLAVNISNSDLQVIKQKIANLEKFTHWNFFCHRQSESEPDYKHAPKPCNLKDKTPDKY